MNFSDADRLELSELCGALVDGTLDMERRNRLAQMLATSEEARRFYVRAMSLSASLHEYASDMPIERPVPAAERPTAWRWALGALATAAVVVFAFWLGALRSGDQSVEAVLADTGGEEFVAQISGAKNCAWRGAAMQPGEELRRGQRVELMSGFAEITFDCGAQVTIEGPATLTVNSDWEAGLERGTLKAHVPAEAVGFRVANPAVYVINPGTEFSIVADAENVREVFVTKGAIEVQSRDGTEGGRNGFALLENQARRFAANGPTEVRDRDQKLARLSSKTQLDRLIRPANYTHWSFDELDGANFPNTSIGANAASSPARIHAPKEFDFARLRSTGRFLGAVRFDGTVSATALVPDLSKRTARTVAFWVKIRENAPLPEVGAILSWPGVQIGWNRNPESGTLGGLSTRAGRMITAGATPLRDGHWHHIAVVLNPGRKPDAMQIRQYVDGRLESAQSKRAGKRTLARGTSQQADLLTIGAGADGTIFRGEMDELFIADRALVPQEIRGLMNRNQPLRAEPLAAN